MGLWLADLFCLPIRGLFIGGMKQLELMYWLGSLFSWALRTREDRYNGTFFLSTDNTFKIVLASSLCMWGLLLHVADYYLITFVVGRGATYILALIVFLGEARTPHCFIWVRAWKPRRWPDSTTSCSTTLTTHLMTPFSLLPTSAAASPLLHWVFCVEKKLI